MFSVTFLKPLLRSPLCLIATGVGFAADVAPGSTPVPIDPVFEARLADGSTASGRIKQLGRGGQIVLVGDKEQTFPLADLISLTRDGDTPPAYPEGSLIVFPEGDRLRAMINTSDDTSLEIQPGALGDQPTRVPRNSMLGVLLSPPPTPKSLSELLTNLREGTRNADVLWLGNGDHLTGDLLSIGTEKIQFQPEAKLLELARPGVLAVGFDPATVKYPKPEGPFLELTFTDGSRLGVSEVNVEQGTIVCKTRFGTTIRPGVDAISRIHLRGGRARYLSETAEAGVQYVGYLGQHPGTFGRNQTWDGFPLRLAGQPYERGIGMLPRTLVAYKLSGDDRTFQATIGLDDRAGERGSVVFRVVLDGKEKFASRPLTKRDAPQFVNVELAGAKLLILVAEFGEGGDVQDSADWVEARLVR